VPDLPDTGLDLHDRHGVALIHEVDGSKMPSAATDDHVGKPRGRRRAATKSVPVIAM